MTPLGQLKMEIMRRGVAPDEGVRRGVAGDAQGMADLREISFALAADFYVAARIESSDKKAFPLQWQNGTAVLTLDNQTIPVALSPLPDFCKQLQKSAGKVSGNVCMDGYCLNIYLKALAQEKKLNRDTSEALSWVRSAVSEGPVNLVQINMDYCELPDRGFQFLEPLVRALKKNFRTFVSLRSFAPEDLTGLDRVYASGIDVLNLPLEGFSRAVALDAIMPTEHGHRALEYAAGVFPLGAVMTELAFHPDKMDLLLNRIDLLTQKNILPLLILPADLQLEHYEVLQGALEHLDQVVTRQRLPLKWLYPSARLVSPLDVRFFTESPKNARLALKPIYKSALGITASEGFAALRRALRVKNISDSYESSGL